MVAKQKLATLWRSMLFRQPEHNMVRAFQKHPKVFDHPCIGIHRCFGLEFKHRSSNRWQNDSGFPLQVLSTTPSSLLLYLVQYVEKLDSGVDGRWWLCSLWSYQTCGFSAWNGETTNWCCLAFLEWRWSQGCGRAHLSRRECSYGSFRGEFFFSKLFILFPSASCHVITWLIAWL